MIPISIKSHDFLSIHDAEFDFRKVDNLVVLGQNGAGKSSFFIDSPLWSIYGQSRYNDADKVVRIGATGASVEFSFELAGQVYRVTRKRSCKGSRKSDLQIEVQRDGEWENISESSLTATEKKIQRLLGLDYKSLISSNFLLQKAGANFAEARPAERKAILSDILGLDKYKTMQTAARKMASECQGAVKATEANIGEWRKDIEREPDIASQLEKTKASKPQVDAFLKKLNIQKEELLREASRLEEKNQQQAMLKRRIDGLQKKISELERGIPGHDQRIQRLKTDCEKNKTRISGEIERIIKEMDRLNRVLEQKAEILQAERKRREIESQLSDLVGKRELAHRIEKELAPLRKSLEHYQTQTDIRRQVKCDRKDCRFLKVSWEATEKLPGLQRQIEDLEKNIPVYSDYEIETLAVELENLSEIAKKISLIEMSEQNIASFMESKRTFESQLVQLSTELGGNIEEIEKAKGRDHLELFRLKEEQKELAGKIDPKIDKEIRRLKDNLTNMSVKINQASLDADLLTKEISRLETELKNVESIKAKIETSEKNLAGWRHRMHLLEILVDAFQTIPSLIYRSVIPSLEIEANRILSLIGVRGMSLKLETEKIAKSKDSISETLEIVIRDDDGEKPYEGQSGGESCRIDLALRIALAYLVANRSGRKLEYVVLDEPFTQLDENGFMVAKECLQKLQSEFKKIILISHLESLKDVFPYSVNVYRANNGTQLELP